MSDQYGLVKYAPMRDSGAIAPHDKGEFYRVLEVNQRLAELQTALKERNKLLRECEKKLDAISFIDDDKEALDLSERIEKLLKGGE